MYSGRAKKNGCASFRIFIRNHVIDSTHRRVSHQHDKAGHAHPMKLSCVDPAFKPPAQTRVNISYSQKVSSAAHHHPLRGSVFSSIIIVSFSGYVYAPEPFHACSVHHHISSHHTHLVVSYNRAPRKKKFSAVRKVARKPPPPPQRFLVHPHRGCF